MLTTRIANVDEIGIPIRAEEVLTLLSLDMTASSGGLYRS